MGCLARCGQTDGLTTGKVSSDVVSSSGTTSQLKVRFQSLRDTDALFQIPMHKTEHHNGDECRQTVAVVESSREGVR